jgi:hypothetical protein
MGNFGRLDLVIAIALAVIVAVWLIAFAALMIFYGHDRTAGDSGFGCGQMAPRHKQVAGSIAPVLRDVEGELSV